MTRSAGPLSDVQVLNLATGAAGAVTGHFLALLGARVILAEPPEGSPLRRVGPFPGDVPDPERSGTFMHLARGHESVVVDRTSAEGQRVLARISRAMNLVIEDAGADDPCGLRTAVQDERGRAPRPGCSILSISPFGLTGPWANVRATDIVVFALSGLMGSVGEPSQEPLQLPGWLIQAYIGLSAFTAAAAAIWWSDVTGTPHDTDVAALDILATSNPHAVSRYSYTGVVDKRQGSNFRQGYPWTLLPCKDGYIGVIVPDRSWDVFCLWMERPDLLTDPRFATRYARSQNVEALAEILTAWTMQHTKDELYHEGQLRHLPFGAVYTLQDSLKLAPQDAREFLQWSAYRDGPSLLQSTSPFLVNGARLRLGTAPRLGEHTAPVLAEFDGAGAVGR